MKNHILKICTFMLPYLAALMAFPTQAATGDLLATVDLPLNNRYSFGGAAIPAAPGIYYVATRGSYQILDIYTPPAGLGAGVATLDATKTVVDAVGNPVSIGCIAWDPTRNIMWATTPRFPLDFRRDVYMIDMGDFTVSGDALATFAFNTDDVDAEERIVFCNGLAYDAGSDSLWVRSSNGLSVYEYDLPSGSLINTTTLNSAEDELVGGVEVGSGNSLYIGMNEKEIEIHLIDKATGDSISQFPFTQASGVIGDLTCDPFTYAPLEAILSKNYSFEGPNYGHGGWYGYYLAFEAAPGTCSLSAMAVPFDIKPTSCRNPINVASKGKGVLPAAINGTANFDVVQIDPSTLRLEGVAPLRSEIQDVSTAYQPFLDKMSELDCNNFGPDGFNDLTLKFSKAAIINAIGGTVVDGEVVVLHLTGKLKYEFGATEIIGEDVMVVLK